MMRLACALLLAASLHAAAEGSFVMTLYHHVSADTPRSTSLTVDELESHILWLKDNGFQIKALPDAIAGLQAGDYSRTDRIAVITFDDSYDNICEAGWPLLQQHRVPFTLFVTTEFVRQKYSSQCSIEQLKAMSDSGLVIIGNHSMTHPHMTDTSPYADKSAWLAAMREEITGAAAFIEQHFGPQPKYFAYPYGEYNQPLQQLLAELGYTGFGQHSGAVGKHSDFLALPRFPLAGNFSRLDTLADKMNSLAFPATAELSSDNPIAVDADANPPRLVLQLQQPVAGKVNCFLANGTPLPIEQQAGRIMVQAETPLGKGRQRYNCTAASGVPGRFYWFSHQWLLE